MQIKNEKDASILMEALDITSNNRMTQYGDPKHNFQDIADLWSGYLGVDVSKKDVSLMMVLFKVAREKAAHKRDNLVDMAGYARTAAMIEGLE